MEIVTEKLQSANRVRNQAEEAAEVYWTCSNRQSADSIPQQSFTPQRSKYCPYTLMLRYVTDVFNIQVSQSTVWICMTAENVDWRLV